MGNRYGRRPLPPEIPESEFSVILENCHGKDKVLLTSYYLKDENAIPPVYILKGQKPIAAQENANEIQADDWAKTEVNLKAILRAVVSEVNKRQNSPIDDTAAYKYFTSGRNKFI